MINGNPAAVLAGGRRDGALRNVENLVKRLYNPGLEQNAVDDPKDKGVTYGAIFLLPHLCYARPMNAKRFVRVAKVIIFIRKLLFGWNTITSVRLVKVNSY